MFQMAENNSAINSIEAALFNCLPALFIYNKKSHHNATCPEMKAARKPFLSKIVYEAVFFLPWEFTNNNNRYKH